MHHLKVLCQILNGAGRVIALVTAEKLHPICTKLLEERQVVGVVDFDSFLGFVRLDAVPVEALSSRIRLVAKTTLVLFFVSRIEGFLGG